jgi:hypothetical protein
MKTALMVAACTPVCWIGVLVLMRRIRASGLVGAGLPGELLDQMERYAWVPGVFAALCVVNFLGGPGGPLLKWGLVVVVLTPGCWLGVVAGLRRLREGGAAGAGSDGLIDTADRLAWVAAALAGVFVTSGLYLVAALLGVMGQ